MYLAFMTLFIMTPFGNIPPIMPFAGPSPTAIVGAPSANTAVAVPLPENARLKDFFANASHLTGTRDNAPGIYEYDLKISGDNKPRELYPPIEPYKESMLPVTEGHVLHYEEVGNPDGIPVLFLHGGPGGGITPFYRQFFDPKKWRAILLDQRGAGKSTPFSELKGNDTWSLVADIERLREHLKIEKWALFGGSWGSTLALVYAEKYPERVTGMMLRGIFLGRRKELEWLYTANGARALFADAWDKFTAPIDANERFELIAAYYKRLTSPDTETRKRAAIAWTQWETAISRLYINYEGLREVETDAKADALARIEAHYMVNKLWLEENQILSDAPKISHIPTIIVQGRYDSVCPLTSAYELHNVLAKSALIIVPDSGHSAREPGIASALVESADYFAGEF